MGALDHVEECIDCGYPLVDCVCVVGERGELTSTVTPDCDACGEALTFCAGHWACFACGDGVDDLDEGGAP